MYSEGEGNLVLCAIEDYSSLFPVSLGWLTGLPLDLYTLLVVLTAVCRLRETNP